MKEEIEKVILETLKQEEIAFSNETEFKHELFHKLATIKVNGVSIAKQEDGFLTPRLHSEAKPQNGLPSKADLIICNPAVYQDFNYEVEHVIELKQRLNSREIKIELDKLDKYTREFDSYWLVSMRKPTSKDVEFPTDHKLVNTMHVHWPDEPINDDCNQATKAPKLSQVFEIINDCIDELLATYGNGKQQYQSYFWCNYEHEQERRHSFPCEGDFNAQLYHLFRERLPKGVFIRSEYKPKKLSRRRIDFVITASDDSWAIPIEIKMNWDQFKPKYKDRKPARAEALTIIDRFEALKHEFNSVIPVLIVIQGDWRITTRQNKEYAENELIKSKTPIFSMSYNESTNQIEKKRYGNSDDFKLIILEEIILEYIVDAFSKMNDSDK